MVRKAKGRGRGHWGHKGRKGKRGGSLPSKGTVGEVIDPFASSGVSLKKSQQFLANFAEANEGYTLDDNQIQFISGKRVTNIRLDNPADVGERVGLSVTRSKWGSGKYEEIKNIGLGVLKKDKSGLYISTRPHKEGEISKKLKELISS